jgi:hypothetical protein
MSIDIITVSWHIMDVQEVRPDLSDAQCREVLAWVIDQYDANRGIDWDLLEYAAEQLFGEDAQ